MVRTLQQDPRGFTLLEMMVIAVVMGIIIAISAPSVSGLLRTSQLTGASNTLVADLHHGRALATAERSTYEIRFVGSTYSLVRVSPFATVTTRVLPQGVSCVASDTACFYGWGLTSPMMITIYNQSQVDTILVSGNGNVTRD